MYQQLLGTDSSDHNLSTSEWKKRYHSWPHRQKNSKGMLQKILFPQIQQFR